MEVASCRVYRTVSSEIASDDITALDAFVFILMSFGAGGSQVVVVAVATVVTTMDDIMN